MAHSYVTYFRFNSIHSKMITDKSPAYQYLWYLLIASIGLGSLCIIMALRAPRRYAWLLVLIAIVLIFHSMQPLKVYRFVFAVIPLWLLLGADVVAQLAVRGNARVWGLAAGLFAVVSLGGVLNVLPNQKELYLSTHATDKCRFIRGHDPIFAVYRYLAHAPGVLGVWQVDRPYYNLPGYYYLHREIPFYDAYSGRVINKDMETISASVSHIVSGDTNLAIPGYTVEKKFGDVQIWRRDENEAPVRQWEVYNPIIGGVEQIMKHVDPNAPTPPANMGIKWR